MSAIQDIFSAAKERITAPFTGYVFFAWLAWNHKLVLAILFGDSLDVRYQELDILYPDAETKLKFWICKPLLTASAITLTLPVINFFVSIWSHSVDAFLKYCQHKIPSRDVIPIAKLKEIEQEIFNIKDDSYRKLKEKDDYAEDLRIQLTEQASELNDHIKKIRVMKQEIERLRAENGQVSEFEKKIILAIGSADTPQVEELKLLNILDTDSGSFKSSAIRLQKKLGLIGGKLSGTWELTTEGVNAYEKLK